MEKLGEKKRSYWRQTIKVLGRILFFVVVLLFILLGALGLPVVQTYIANKLVKTFKAKTGTHIAVGSVRISLTGNIRVRNFEVHDLQSDTLLYLNDLKLKVDWLKLLDNELYIRSVELNSVVANVSRPESSKDFNFQFLLDVLSSDTVPADTVATPMWPITVENTNLTNIRAVYNDGFGKMRAGLNLTKLGVSDLFIDLDHNTIKANAIELDNTDGRFAFLADSSSHAPQTLTHAESDRHDNTSNNYFTDWNITTNRFRVNNVNLAYDDGNIAPAAEGIDYSHLGVKGFSAVISHIAVLPNGYFMSIDTLALVERSGFALNELSGTASMSDSVVALKDIKAVTPNSNIQANMELTFDNHHALANDFWSSRVDVAMSQSAIKGVDVLYFAPFLSQNDWFNDVGEKLDMSGHLKGKLNDLQVTDLHLSGMEGTSLSSTVHVKGLPDIDKLAYNAVVDDLSSCLSDLKRLTSDSIDASISLPEKFNLSMQVAGTASYCDGNIKLKSSFGDMMADGFYRWEAPVGRDTFFVDFSVADFSVDKMLNDTVYGKATLTGMANGCGLFGGELNGNGMVEVNAFDYGNYTYNNISFDGSIKGADVSLNAKGTDPNLVFDLKGHMQADDSLYKGAVTLNLVNADLMALGFSESGLVVSTTLNANIDARYSDSFDGAAQLYQTKIITGTESLPIDTFQVNVHAVPNDLTVDVESSLVDAGFKANMSVSQLLTVYENAFQTYLGKADTTSLLSNKSCSLQIDVHPSQELLAQLVPGMERLSVNRIEGSYATNNNDLSLKVDIPEMVYSGLVFDSMALTVKGNDDLLKLDFNLDKLAYDTLMVKQLRIEEDLHRGTLHSTIAIGDSSSLPRYYFANTIVPTATGYLVTFDDDGVVLDSKPWAVSKTNSLAINDNSLTANEFEFKNNNEALALTTSETDLTILFTDFKIENLANIIEQEKDKSLLKGSVDGVLTMPFTGNSLAANLDFENLSVVDSLVGNVYVDLKTESDTLFVAAQWENSPNKGDVKGIITQLSTDPLYDLRMLLDIDNLKRLEQMSMGELSELGGKVNGDITLKGTADHYQMDGFVGFDSTTFKLNSLNFKASIPNEKIAIDAKGFHFNDFSIEDKDKKQLTLNGDVFTDNFLDYDYNLDLVTKNFQPVNSTIDDNPLFFGSLNMDADIKLKGNLDNPKVNAALKINRSTDLTYRMPGSELQLVSSEGTVEFIDPNKVSDTTSIDLYDDILNDSLMMKLQGMDLALNLIIEDGAKFRVDIDPTSGDYLTLSGRSSLNFSSDITGKQTVTGIYEVKEGVYQLSFYGMVKKTFAIVPGSTISWSGQPLDADMNINAAYEVRVSSTALLSQEMSSMTEGEQNAYKQPLPYTVKLNIRGFLAQPEISFNLELPDKYLLAYPLLANKLNVLNTPEMASELNKQVFSLLVAGSFMPTSPLASSGSTTAGMVGTAARNSVNGLLAGQLNNMSAKYVQGVDLDFGLTSYEDYTSGTGSTRTELDVQVSKKLMNDRLEVEAMGSFNFDSEKETTPTNATQKNTGEFAVSYLLTPDGEYKLRAYYQNAYDTFDGEYGYSGIALIFEREFDRSEKQRKKNAERVAKKQQRMAKKAPKRRNQ